MADESTVPRPQSIYGQTKLAGEQEVLESGRRYGVEVVVLRPAWVYGAGCPRTEKLRRALHQRTFVMVGAGRNLRHPIYIDDMIAAARLAATRSGIAGDVIVVAGEQAVTTGELIDAFCAAFQLPRPWLRVPYAMGVLAADCTESVCRLIGCEPPLSRRTLEFFDTNNSFDITRARDVLGFTPRYPLAAGLLATRDRMGLGAESARHTPL